MNTPVSFEIAKLLKEKGWDKETLCYYFEDGEFRQNIIRDTYGYYGVEYTVEYSELTDNWNNNYTRKKMVIVVLVVIKMKDILKHSHLLLLQR